MFTGHAREDTSAGVVGSEFGDMHGSEADVCPGSLLTCLTGTPPPPFRPPCRSRLAASICGNGELLHDPWQASSASLTQRPRCPLNWRPRLTPIRPPLRLRSCDRPR